MLHYLVAAGVGAAVSTLAYVGVQLWTGKPITWKGAAISALGGVVAGALCATPGGIAALNAGGARALAFVAADGAAAAGTEKIAENVLEKKPLGEGVAEAAAWGAATAPVAYLGLRGYMHQLSKVFFPGAAAAYNAAEEAVAKGVADASRTGARRFAVSAANAIAIAGANPTVARAIGGAGHSAPKPPSTLGDDPSPVAAEPVEPPAAPAETVTDDTTVEMEEGAGAIASEERPTPERSSPGGRGLIGALGEGEEP